jgi:lincosamide nucleotidyltransferase A/C/D/E
MPAEQALTLLAALKTSGVDACVAGGWAVDALLGGQTRPHSDLDLWVDALALESVFAAFVELDVDRVYPWPGDRPWNFVLHDGHSRRVDLHLYEQIGAGRLHYGSVTAPFIFTEQDVSGRGSIAGVEVRCERAEWAVKCHLGYVPRDTDRHDVDLLCTRFAIERPESYR